MDENSGAVPPAMPLAAAGRAERLNAVIASLNENLGIVDSLDLTLAAALLDQVIHELKRHADS